MKIISSKYIISKQLFIIFIIWFSSSVCYSQTDEKKSIELSLRSYGNKIVLRYFPTSTYLFNLANKNGYVIERAIQIKNIPADKLTYTAINSSPKKPWSEKKWEDELANRKNVDSNTLKLAALAMALGMEPATKKAGDVLENDLKSLKVKITESQNKLAFILFSTSGSLLAAEGLGMMAEDNNVSIGQTYVYRISINDNSKSNIINWVYKTVECKAFNPLYLKDKATIKINEDDKQINFSFSKLTDYYAFTIQRSKDGGKIFEKLSSIPEIKLSHGDNEENNKNAYLDSNLINYKKYQYRVYGSTIFADQLLIAEFEAMPRDKTPPPAPTLKSAMQIKIKEVELVWEMPNETIADLKGFIVSRSTEDGGVYTPINKTPLAPSTRKFVDGGFDNEGENYYKVQSVDTAGNISFSFPIHANLIDSTPPNIPIISSAIIDSLGKITITIKPNTEKDFLGYQLLKANAIDHEFSLIQETFNDSTNEKTFVLYDSTTLNTLTKNIFYQAIAFDTHFNQSEASKIIELKRRDTIPPVSPLITDYFVSDSAIQINFVNSSSEDAIANMLLRREDGKLKYDTIFVNKNLQQNTYSDYKIISGVAYEYAMMAKDDANLYSKISNSLQLKATPNVKLSTPNVTASFDKNSELVTLNFSLSDRLNVQKIAITIFYKVNENSNWLKLTSIDYEKGKTFMYKPPKCKIIEYVIKISDNKNKVSNFSKEARLIF